MMKASKLWVILLINFLGTFTCEAQSWQSMADSVKKEYLFCWDNYKKLAWGFDEVKPISGQPFNWYASTLYMDKIDALDGLYMMGFKNEGNEVVKDLVKNANWDKDISVSAFEFNIRLVGGLLASYEITKNKQLLTLAKTLADRLIPVFSTTTGMPYRFVNLKTGEVKGAISNPAEIGTYIIEWGTLSRLTGDKKYYGYAKRALVALFNRRSTLNLVGESINVETGKWTSTSSHVSGGIDSYYEYLIKGWLLFKDEDLKNMWQVYKPALDKYLLDKVASGWWYGYADMNTGMRTQTYYGALDAFYPAVLVLSGDLQGAQQLEQSCFAMWNLHHLEPEVIDYKKMEVVKGAEAYALRPEIIESAYYLFTRTHDKKYLEMGKKIFNDLKLYCKDSFGYAEVSDVLTKKKGDREHSFFFAETLKYLYLLFDAATPKHFQFDDYIFNTEAHPMKKQFTGK